MSVSDKTAAVAESTLIPLPAATVYNSEGLLLLPVPLPWVLFFSEQQLGAATS